MRSSEHTHGNGGTGGKLSRLRRGCIFRRRSITCAHTAVSSSDTSDVSQAYLYRYLYRLFICGYRTRVVTMACPTGGGGAPRPLYPLRTETNKQTKNEKKNTKGKLGSLDQA